eukprot:evm.model.scf_762.1 EVM.evm.TU.scf_762.1   scf_762:1294-3123(+)
MAGQGQQGTGPPNEASEAPGLRIQLLAPRDAAPTPSLSGTSGPIAVSPCVYPIVLAPVDARSGCQEAAGIAGAPPAVIGLAVPGDGDKLLAGAPEKIGAELAGARDAGARGGGLAGLPPEVKLQLLEAMGIQGLVGGGAEGEGGEARVEARQLMQRQVSFGLIPAATHESTAGLALARSPAAPDVRHTSAKERNRQAQQRFRERQKLRIAGLQNKVVELTTHVHLLQAELEHTRKERDALMMELKVCCPARPVQ